ncbi:MAG: TonB-dependent receptor, partial [Bdellovibrionales bacterium]|nr:TonB-dependent receptor [Bdellovibrionales bacterium]NQZ18884.1 TonB-dependent receptor [Bdellovibrionales bacterium]
RGSGQSGRVLTLFNDIPLNFASGFGAPNGLLPKEAINETIVIKGPASLFYGSQAMGGSLNFLPKKFERAEVSLTMSDTNASFLPWREGGLAQSSWHVASPLISDEDNHLQVSLFTEKNDGQFPYQLSSISGDRFHNTQNLSRILVNGKHKTTHSEWGYDFIFGKEILQSPGAANSVYLTRGDTDSYLGSAYYQYFFSDASDLKTRVSYLQNDAEFLDVTGINYTDLTTVISQTEYSHQWTHWLNTQIYLDYFNHDMNSSFSGDGLNENRFESSFVSQIYFTPQLFFQPGVRYVGNFDIYLPAGGLFYSFNKLRSWLNYSEGFRAPSLSDLYSQSPFFVGNPNLTPEQSQQWELGLAKDYEVKNRALDWNFEFRVFNIEYDNFMESFQITPGVFTRDNFSGGTSKGFDLSVAVRFDVIENYYRYNYLDTNNDQTGMDFRLSPRQQMTWGLIYSSRWARFEAQNSYWQDYYDGSSAALTKLDNWSQWNFYIHSPSWHKFNVSLGLINAFNQAKELTLNYPEPQRRYWMQVRYVF